MFLSKDDIKMAASIDSTAHMSEGELLLVK